MHKVGNKCYKSNKESNGYEREWIEKIEYNENNNRIICLEIYKRYGIHTLKLIPSI